MSKGVSPIIATLLVLLIAVSLGGGFFIFSNQTFRDVSDTASNEIKQSNNDLLAGIKIESVAYASGNNTVYVRNTGGNNVDTSTITIFINGQIITNVTASPEFVESDGIATITLGSAAIPDSLCDGKRSLMVSVRSADDSIPVNVGVTPTCKLSLA